MNEILSELTQFVISDHKSSGKMLATTRQRWLAEGACMKVLNSAHVLNRAI